MADRDQKVAAVWPPHARLALTMPRTGRLEVEDALLPRSSPAHALPPPSLPPLARSAEATAAAAPPSSCVLAVTSYLALASRKLFLVSSIISANL